MSTLCLHPPQDFLLGNRHYDYALALLIACLLPMLRWVLNRVLFEVRACLRMCRDTTQCPCMDNTHTPASPCPLLLAWTIHTCMPLPPAPCMNNTHLYAPALCSLHEQHTHTHTPAGPCPLLPAWTTHTTRLHAPALCSLL